MSRFPVKNVAVCFSLIFMMIHVVLPAQERTDSSRMVSMDDIVVIASRVPEKWLKTGVQKADRRYFSRSGSGSFFDALEHIKGVQMITPSMGFRILNTRGFNNTTNVRFVQLVDGMDVQSPHIGSPIGNALGPSDLDIRTVEISPGIAATLYGLNAVNGLADFATRDPFSDQGLSVQQKTAVAHLGETDVSARLYSETSIRYAKAITSRWAVKINVGYNRGYDWIADDMTDINPNANISTGLTGDDNPAKDPVNSYGNESPNRRTLVLNGRRYVVSRTGYTERDVTDYGLSTFKGDASVFFKPGEHTTISYTFRGATLDNVYQRANRFRLENYFLQQQALQLRSGSVKANLYFNSENTGRSYNLRSAAENMDRAFRTDANWFNQYSSNFAAAGTGNIADAHRTARQLTDDGRYEPGSDAFKRELDKITSINNWDSGAALRVRASFVHGDLQWDLTEKTGRLLGFGLEVLWGADFRHYIVHPDGNYFINPEPGKDGRNLTYGKYGSFLSLNKDLLNKKLRFGFALRADKYDYFKVHLSPRLTASYSPTPAHSIRASLQQGYRFPIIFEAFSNVNSGGVKRVGGLPVMSNGIFENAWLQTSIASFQNAVINDINGSGINEAAAIEKNKVLLKKNNYTYLTPERVRSLELGYRGYVLQNALRIDADVYFNKYNSFIAQVNMNVPNTSNPDSIPYALYNRNMQSPYRMWTNSTSGVYNYGFGVELAYHWKELIYVTGNLNYAKLTRQEAKDGLEDGFNTPSWISSISVATGQPPGRLNGGATFRWQSSFYWQSFLVSGIVPSYYTVDAYAGYRFRNAPVSVKAGATNLLNRYYTSFLAGPSIGGFYYCTLSFGIND